MEIMVPTEVCLVCQRIGIPVKPYEVRSEGRSGEETLCAEHAEVLEKVLAAGNQSKNDTAAAAGKRPTTTKPTTKAAAKRTPTKPSAATRSTSKTARNTGSKTASKSASQSGAARVDGEAPRRMTGPASRVVTMEEIEALREKPDS